MHKADFKRWVTTALWEAYKPITDQEAKVFYSAQRAGDTPLEAFVRVIHLRVP